MPFKVKVKKLAFKMTKQHYRSCGELCKDMDNATKLMFKYTFLILHWMDQHPHLVNKILNGETTSQSKYYYNRKGRNRYENKDALSHIVIVDDNVDHTRLCNKELEGHYNTP